MSEFCGDSEYFMIKSFSIVSLFQSLRLKNVNHLDNICLMLVQ